MIDVLLVDDHPLVRELLREFIQTYADLVIVGEAQNGEEALTLVAALRPSIILIDVHLPKMNGIQATRVMKDISPSSAIIGLTAGAPGVEALMIAAGATAVLDKGEVTTSLYPLILKAVTGRAHKMAAGKDPLNGHKHAPIVGENAER